MNRGGHLCAVVRYAPASSLPPRPSAISVRIAAIITRPLPLQRAALPYEGRLREILIAFKYQQRTGFRRPLAALLLEVLAERYAGIAFNAIVPVPLHPARLRQRGYNQAELLSQLIAKETGLPHHPEWLQRSEDTPPLAELGRGERLKTLRSVFTAVPEVAGQQLLLIDDIFTTGATAESCSRALLQQGASDVYVLAVAAGYALP